MPKWLKLLLLIVPLLAVAIGGYLYYRVAVQPGFHLGGTAPERLYIYPGASWSDVVDSLRVRTSSPRAADLQHLMRWASRGSTPRPGAYLIAPDATTLQVYRQLRHGHQQPIRFVVPSVRLPEQMWQRMARQLMADSTTIASAMTDPQLLDSLGIPDSTMAYHILPNTYEVYWSLTPRQLVVRMAQEYHRYWTEERRAQAEAIGCTPYEVAIIASIVEEESAKADELPTIAGLYLNRLRVGMPLQADPTVKYAVGDFALRRILHSHTTTPSPYNTYLHTGLPPTPIRIPSIQGLEAVLTAEQHSYLYMCARADFSGYHAFAATYSEHLLNARAYTRELNRRGIR